MEISIKYLLPMLVVFNNKNYFCMIDYAFGSLYWLNEPEDAEQKKIIEQEVLRKTDANFLKNIQNIEDVKIGKNINNLLDDIKNNSLIKKYSVDLDSLNQEKEIEVDNG